MSAGWGVEAAETGQVRFTRKSDGSLRILWQAEEERSLSHNLVNGCIDRRASQRVEIERNDGVAIRELLHIFAGRVEPVKVVQVRHGREERRCGALLESHDDTSLAGAFNFVALHNRTGTAKSVAKHFLVDLQRVR